MFQGASPGVVYDKYSVNKTIGEPPALPPLDARTRLSRQLLHAASA